MVSNHAHRFRNESDVTKKIAVLYLANVAVLVVGNFELVGLLNSPCMRSLTKSFLKLNCEFLGNCEVLRQVFPPLECRLMQIQPRRTVLPRRG
jgi:hypothetical protein